MIDLLIVAAFVVYAIYSGLSARRAASTGLQEYFLAGRTIKGWRAGVSMAATQFAADTPLLVVGLIASGGIFLIWQLWVYGIAFLMMGFVFAVHWRRAGVLTDAEFTELRYSARGALALRTVKALYYGTLINCVVMAFVLVAAIRIAEVFLPWHEWLSADFYQSLVQLTRATGLSIGNTATGLDADISTTNNAISIVVLMSFTLFYSATGGLRSVVATDVVQFTLAILGTLAYAVVMLNATGGLSGLSERIVDIYGQATASELLSFSPTGEALLLPFLVIIALQWFFQMNSDGTGYLAQRSMACRTDRDARIAAVVFSWLQIVLRSLIWIVIGLGLLVLYPFDPQAAGSDEFIASREMLFVQGIDDLLQPGLRGLMLTGLLAALASTVDTHLNWGASYWSNDLYDRLVCRAWLKRTPGNRELVWVARWSNVLILALALIIMSQLGSIQQGWKMSLLLGAGTGSVLVLRWLWERINLYSELAAIVVALIASGFLLHLFPEPDQEWLRLALMALLSTVAAVGITFVTPPTDQHVLSAFYRRVKPVGWWRKTAIANGEDGAMPLIRFRRDAMLVATGSVSLLFMLVGLGRLLVGAPGDSIMVSLLFVSISLAALPFWWSAVAKHGTADQHVA
ncbi:MAG: Na+:solute symporter [Betaproteobacteria bacterium]|nr:MAG: Na+:solute symporter [Betaproteobacteria bacterium]